MFVKLRHIVEMSEGTTYLLGNATIVGQSIAGGYTLSEGACAIVDGITYPVPGVSALFYAGGACQIASGTVLIATSLTSSFCPPIGWVGASVGFGLKRLGNRIVDAANVANPLPTITKVV